MSIASFWESILHRWFLLSAIYLILSPAGARALSPVDVFRTAQPAVVEVYARDADARPLPYGYGSGVVIHALQVVTNCYVLENAQRIEIVQAGTTLSATLEHRDQGRDLCLLQVPGLTAPPAVLRALHDLAVGERVYALGNVMGLGISISEGLISALPEQGNVRSIQTTALIAPGSSGGGLFDAEGQLLGMTVFQESEGQNINFVLPGNWLHEIPQRAQTPPEATPEATSLYWQNKSISLENAEDWQGLLAHAQRWIAVAPGAAEAFFALGLAQHRLEHYHDAIQAYETTLRLQPNHVTAWGWLSLAYTATAQWEQAIHAGMTATRRGAQVAVGWIALGQVYGHQQQVDKAVEAYLQATRVAPYHLGAWKVLGDFYLQNNQLDNAVAALQRIVDLQPDVATNWFYLGTTLLDLHKPRQALKALQRVLAIDPDMADGPLMLAYAYGSLGQPRKALEAARTALRLYTEAPGQARAWEMIGRLYYGIEHYAEAIGALQEALRLQPNALPVMLLLSEMLRKNGEFAHAEEVAQEATRLEPHNPLVWSSLGGVYVDAEQPHKAEEALRQALRLQPDGKDVWHTLGWVYHQLGERGKVRETYIQLAKLDRTMATQYYQMFMLPYGEEKPQ